MKQFLLTKLNQLINKTDIEISSEEKILLIEYIMMLAHWNKAYNLTSIRDPEQMLIKHIMDSLIVSPYLIGDTIIDVGTGPGLPGVPLSIINKNKTFYLLDSLGKRITFLKQVIHNLALKNATPIKNRSEEFTENKFDIVISRAFSSLNQFITVTAHLLKENGSFYALKGIYNKDEIKQLPIGYYIDSVIKLNVPSLEEERHLICIKKQI